MKIHLYIVFVFFKLNYCVPPPRKKIASKKENKGSNQTTAIDINVHHIHCQNMYFYISSVESSIQKEQNKDYIAKNTFL